MNDKEESVMNYDNIFGDDKKEYEVTETICQDKLDDDLNAIFTHNGFLKQLTDLSLACCDLLASSTILKADGVCENTEVNLNKLTQSMGVIYTLLETFIVSDEKIYNTTEEIRDKYIEQELKKINKNQLDITSLAINNRIAHLFNGEKYE